MEANTISEEGLNSGFEEVPSSLDTELEQGIERNSGVTLLSGDPTDAPEPLIDRSSDSLIWLLGNTLHYVETTYTQSNGMEYHQLALMTGM